MDGLDWFYPPFTREPIYLPKKDAYVQVAFLRTSAIAAAPGSCRTTRWGVSRDLGIPEGLGTGAAAFGFRRGWVWEERILFAPVGPCFSSLFGSC